MWGLKGLVLILCCLQYWQATNGATWISKRTIATPSGLLATFYGDGDLTLETCQAECERQESFTCASVLIHDVPTATSCTLYSARWFGSLDENSAGLTMYSERSDIILLNEACSADSECLHLGDAVCVSGICECATVGDTEPGLNKCRPDTSSDVQCAVGDSTGCTCTNDDRNAPDLCSSCWSRVSAIFNIGTEATYLNYQVEDVGVAECLGQCDTLSDDQCAAVMYFSPFCWIVSSSVATTATVNTYTGSNIFRRANDCAPSCPSADWKIYENSCYLFVTDPRQTQSNAAIKCEELGSHLLWIDSLEELTWIQDTIKNDSVLVARAKYWTDGVKINGEWNWNISGVVIPDEDLHWAPREPNNNHDREYSINLLNSRSRPGYFYNDAYGKKNMAYICKI